MVCICCFLTSENGHEFLPAPALFAVGRRPRRVRRRARRAALRSAAKDEDQDGVLQGTDEDQHPCLPRGRGVGGVCRKINGEMAVGVSEHWVLYHWPMFLNQFLKGNMNEHDYNPLGVHCCQKRNRNQRSHFRVRVPDVQKKTPMWWKIGGDPHAVACERLKMGAESNQEGGIWDELVIP